MAKNEYSCSCNIIDTDVLNKVKKNFDSEFNLDKMIAFFKTLGDGTRLKILWALDIHELCVCELCEILNMNKSAVSHQLGYLRKASLVKFRKEGKTVYYSLNDYHVKEIFEMAMEHINEEKEI